MLEPELENGNSSEPMRSLSTCATVRDVVYAAFTSGRRHRESRRRRHVSDQGRRPSVSDAHCDETSGGVARYRQYNEEKAVSMAPRVALTHLEVVSEGERQAAA